MYSRVVVGLTTIPSRVKYLPAVIAALSDQTRRADTIYVSIPRFSTKEMGHQYPIKQIAKILKRGAGENSAVLLVDEDYGALTKLVGMWLYEKSADTLLITVDDDQLYSNTFIETMCKGAEAHPGCAVCLCGHLLGKSPFLWGFRCSRRDDSALVRSLYLDPDTQVTVQSGWCGCAYPRGKMGDTLPESLEALRIGPNKLPLLGRHDDIYISSWMYLRGVKKYVVAYQGNHHDEEMDHAMQGALSSNDDVRTLRTMARHTKEFWDFACKMQSMGLLETDSVPWNKAVSSYSFVVGAAITGFAAICVYYLWKKNKK